MTFSYPFSRRQNRGFGLLMLILLLIWSGARLYDFFQPIPAGTLPFEDFPVFSASYQAPCVEINQADRATWDSLPGIGAKLSDRIVRYRRKRGGFESIEDLQKVYGLKKETLSRIEANLWMENSIVLRPQRKTKYAQKKSRTYYHKTSSQSRAISQTPLLDLNQADSLQLEALPGIGPKLATRILKYRKILGYYYHVDQLRSVYGLSEENFQRMKPSLTAILPPSPSQSSINTANRWQIQKLAFWDKNLADSLLLSRKEIGRFEQWEEISQLSFVTARGLEELMIYFKLESVGSK